MVSSVGSSGPSAKRLPIDLNRLLAPYSTARSSLMPKSGRLKFSERAARRSRASMAHFVAWASRLMTRRFGAPKIEQLRPRHIPVITPHAKQWHPVIHLSVLPKPPTRLAAAPRRWVQSRIPMGSRRRSARSRFYWHRRSTDQRAIQSDKQAVRRRSRIQGRVCRHALDMALVALGM